MENPFQRNSNIIPYTPQKNYYNSASPLASSSVFNNNYYLKQLKIPDSLKKNYDQQQYSYSSTPITNKIYPFSQPTSFEKSNNHLNFTNNNKKTNENPFYRKHLCIPGVQISKIHPFQPETNSQLYSLMDAKNLNLQGYGNYPYKYPSSYQNDYLLNHGNHKLSPYFSQYKLQKLRQQTEKVDNNKLNHDTLQEQHYPSHISNPNSTKNNQILRNMFDNMSKKQGFSNVSGDTTKAKGMFAGIYTKMNQNSPVQTGQENSFGQQTKRNKKEVDLFAELFQKVQQKVDNQQWQQTEEEKLLQAKNMFAEVYGKMRTQQLLKGSIPFKQLYQIHKSTSFSDKNIQDEEAIKARAIFGQVYMRMYDAASADKNSGIQDKQSMDKAKRMFGQVFDRINYSLSKQSHPKEDSSPKQQYLRLNEENQYNTNSHKTPQSDQNLRDTKNRNSGQFGQENRGSGTYSPYVTRQHIPDQRNFSSQTLRNLVPNENTSGSFKLRQLENASSSHQNQALISKRSGGFPEKVEFRLKDFYLVG